MDIHQLEDLIFKISVKCKSYITNYDFEEDFHFDSRISMNLFEKSDFLLKIPLEKLGKEIAHIVASSFMHDKKDEVEIAYYEDKWLNNVPNELIVEDTHYWQAYFKEVDFGSLNQTLKLCLESLSSYNSKDANSFLLSQIDLNLYKALITNPQLLKSLNWRVFEKLIANIIESFGYEVELMQGTKDNGIDVVAIKKIDTFGIHRYLIQAKRWSNNVGVEPVQQLLFKQSDIGATKSCLVTTAHFTSGAWQLANRYKYILELKDFEKIQDWLRIASVLKSKINMDEL